jgi:hypothetical protein
MLNNFYKFFKIVFLLAMFLFTQNSFAQLTGRKNIPGDYATLAAAIADWNTQRVGACGVTFNVAAGYTESITAPIVAELVNSKMEAGKYSYVWNASDVATGLYIYELRTDKFVSVKKMMLLK